MSSGPQYPLRAAAPPAAQWTLRDRVPAAADWILRELAPPAAPRPNLLDRVRERLRTAHYSRRTEQAYIGWIRRFILFHGRRHPSRLGEAEVTRFLSGLAVERKVASSTQNQALSALLFLYGEVLKKDLPWLEGLVRARGPRRLPTVLSRAEVQSVLGRLRGTPRLVAALLYGAGLRLTEGLRLRVKDLDFEGSQIVVRGGKGDKDRVTLLPAALREPLQGQLETARKQHEQDLSGGAGWVELPAALARKYPNAGREWPWQWVFPATRHYTEPGTGRIRRHHLHESVVQRDVRKAILDSGITRSASCHTFRHSFATHLLQGVAFLPCHPPRTETLAAGVSD